MMNQTTLVYKGICCTIIILVGELGDMFLHLLVIFHWELFKITDIFPLGIGSSLSTHSRYG